MIATMPPFLSTIPFIHSAQITRFCKNRLNKAGFLYLGMRVWMMSKTVGSDR